MPLPTPPLATSVAHTSVPPGAQDDETSGPTLTSIGDHYRQQRAKIVVVVILVAVVTVLFVGYDSQIMEALRPWKNFLVQAGVGGHGYSTIVIFAGYVFGLLGFLPCFVGAALGSAACYPYNQRFLLFFMVFFYITSILSLVVSEFCAKMGDFCPARGPKDTSSRVCSGEWRIRDGFVDSLTAVSCSLAWNFQGVIPLSFCIVNMVLPSIPSLRFTSYFIATILSLPKARVRHARGFLNGAAGKTR
ncbi:MAG: hypothetical protein BJ554DRAFT_47 [Olpidium bornovanus]|uniref:Transmembrane protein n=1 Tax=Olpidium bornovanus TaxID=278681 RepID=A0A8H7ZU54_9FUNG|nr:MAG: hypothetical protein BJ554DRAFT_47 [Olpidium bornovanus]